MIDPKKLDNKTILADLEMQVKAANSAMRNGDFSGLAKLQSRDRKSVV
jgi:hypothetical protein